MQGRLRRTGFTLVEVLVVIGVMLLLMTIGVIAYSKLDAVAASKSTQTRLASCASIMAEYETNAGSLAALQGNFDSIYPFTTLATPNQYQAIATGGLVVTFGAASRNPVIKLALSRPSPPITPTQGNFPPVGLTGVFMQQAVQFPSAKAVLAQLPPDAMLLAADGTPYMTVPNPPNFPATALPVVLDGWKDPIILVPSSGLTGVTFAGITGTSTITSADGRPFFASAGPDGDFASGDDNLYSTKVIVHTP